MSSRRLIAIAIASLLMLWFSACSTHTEPLTMSANPSIQVAPNAASVEVLKQQQFTATVSDSSAVVWSINGVAGGNSSVGTISSTGLYTAPASVPSPSEVTVRGAVAGDTSYFASATVTVTPAPPPVSVTIAPKVISLQVATSQPFTATVSNATDTSVTWEVNNVTGGSSASGTISTSGTYTAPAAVPVPNPVTIKAVSNADPSKSDSALVTITPAPPPISVAVTPSHPTVIVGQTQPFTADVSGTTNHNVSWTVSGASCSGASCGTIDSSGLYQAPAAVPSPDATVTVTATSAADSTKKGTATVTVTTVPTPGVSLTPSTDQVLPVGAGNSLTVLATVTNDPHNDGVQWSLRCISDGESSGSFQGDCADDPPPNGDGDGDITLTSTAHQATVSCPALDETKAIVFELKATSIATGTGGSQGSSKIQVTCQ